MPDQPSDIMFSPRVKAVQTARGSRKVFAARDAAGSWPADITADLATFIATVTTCYLASASVDGQPYVQHRGGPAGFLRVLDTSTLAFADFKGNRQYITTGNLVENARVHLFLMDYENQRRAKLWGSARVIEGDPELEQRLRPLGYQARIEQVILIKVAAWDINCHQHIPQMFLARDVAETVKTLQARIVAQAAELTELRARLTDC